MDTPAYDILVVGGGGAAKVYPMRSHTVSAEGGAAAVISADDSRDAHAYDTISGGDWLCDQDAVEAFVDEAPAEMLRLEHWGCPWSRETDGHIAVRPFGGMKNQRTWFAADKTGFHLLHTIFQTTLKYDSISRKDEWFVTRLLVEDGRCSGVVAIELSTGKVQAFPARAVILTTGGAGKIYPFTTNASIKTGDGMSLAYRAGAPLKDMEFVQYHPTGLPFTGILITEAARAEGGWLLNKDGYRYLQDYDLGEPQPQPVLRSMELGPRDRLSQAFVKEMEKGRTIETEHGKVVHLDIRHLGKKKIDAKIPFVRELCLKYENLDPVDELIPVRPVVHYMMGGVHTDLTGATQLPGLYAAGEVACVSINGANRLGSNSLTELLVFGARAGTAAATYALERPAPAPTLGAQTADEERRLRREFLEKSGGRERVAALRSEMQETMEAGAGIYRDRSGLEAAAGRLHELQDRLADVAPDDRSRTFNTELVAWLELCCMLDVAEAVIASALARRESRGAHQRTDYPLRDDENYLTHSLAHRAQDGGARIDYLPVTLTRWPPGERTYGR
jgi:fumarate reductase flavoprotein subunit